MIKYTFLLILLCLSVDVFAQVDTVFVTKNATDYSSLIIKVKEGETKLEALQKDYIRKGYLDIQVQEVSADSFIISNDRIYRIDDFILKIEGDSTVYNLEIAETAFYNEENIDRALAQEYYEYVDEGYLNTEIEIAKFEVDSLDQSIDILANIRRGELVKVSSIVFSGNRINSQDYLTKVSGMRDSLIASKQNINRIKQNLIGSELFDEVSDPKVFQQDGEPILFVAVQERTLNQLDGLIGYVPDATGKGQIVGDLDVSLWNVLNDGNAFELMYQRLRPETSRIQLSVSQDWIANIPLKIGLDFSLYQNDSTYQTRNIGLYSSYLVASNFKLNGRIYSTTSNSSRETGVQQEPDGSKQGSDLGFTYSSLDRVEVPQKGIRIDLIYGIASKDIDNDSSVAFRQQRLETRINTYVPVFKNSVIATSINGFYVIGDEFTESDLVRFGGANSFRGYAEEQFTASELLWGDVEYRFLTDQNSYLFLFTAVGVYNRSQLYSEPNNSFTQNDFLYSGGFGLSYKTAIGRLKFSYALSSTETLGNGKVHFGIRTSL
tara:strand:- start:5063 stop:6706 length:1644 start_codon:yes stop_codon:yes gene_type:complete